MARRKFDFDSNWFRILMLIFGSVTSTCVLAFSVLAITNIYKENFTNVPLFMFWMFVFLGLTRLISFARDRTKLNFIRFCILFVLSLAIGIAILFANSNPYLFSICGGLYCFTIIFSRIFKMIGKHDLRNILFNVLIILFAALMSIGMFISTGNNEITSVVVVECLFIAIVSLIEVAIAAFSQLKVRVLLKIVLKTYSLEVIFGLITLMVAFSLVFMVYEPSMETFGDALWYSFAVVTTIGFGDYAATTLIGRILTVVLGVYGLVVVAIITSIIVNFYNETSGKHDTEKLKEIKKEEDEIKKNSHLIIKVKSAEIAFFILTIIHIYI